MKYLKILYVFFLLLGLNEIKAQLPLSDATFSLTHTDDFNSSTLSPQWYTSYNWGPTLAGLAINSATNVSLTYSTGYLALKTATSAPITYTPGAHSPYNYVTGMVSSTYTCKYGYYEVKAKNPIGRGFALGFWLLGGTTSTACPAALGGGWHYEIDVMESVGDMSYNNYETGCVHHWRDQSDCQRYYNYDCVITGLPDLSLEHKYGVFWEPDRITWYIDDKEVLMRYDATYTPQGFMGVLLTLDIDDRPGNYAPSTNPLITPFPSYYLINYFNAYQLLPDCNSDEIFWGIAFNPLTYNYAVKKTVSLGGAACTAPSTINTSSNVSLWATDYILLDEGTTIDDNGSGSFMAKITKCPN